MKFRILDLVIFTACIAVLFAVYPVDRLFFRQLLFIGLISVSSLALCCIPCQQPNITAKGALGGAFTTAIYYLVLLFFYRQVTTPPVFEPDPGTLEAFLNSLAGELIVATALAPILGAAMGPLLYSHIDASHMTTQLRTFRKWSWALFAGTMTLLFFMMLDRVQFAGLGRDWSWVAIIVFAVFIVFTIGWTSGTARSQEVASAETDTA